MACPRLLSSNEEYAGDRRSLARRCSVSRYGLSLNIIKENSESASEPQQVSPWRPEHLCCCHVKDFIPLANRG